MSLSKLIEQNLSKYLPSEKTEPKILHRAMRYSVFPGGKRIRPTVLMEMASACGGSARDAVPAACAVELIHAYSLIHDDLPSMDDDDLRRGRPSCHKAFGEAVAILAGDALLTLAFNIIAENNPARSGARMVQVLSSAIGSKGMVGGQALDVELGGGSTKTKLINRLKTAKLFEASAIMGAIAAGASEKKILMAGKYGILLGEAFQMTDDILDGENNFSRAEAKAVLIKAKNALSVLGIKASTLIKIADSVSERI